MTPLVEQWFVTCLLVCGPREANEKEWEYLDRIQYWFKTTIPNGSGCGWYAHWFVKWLGDQNNVHKNTKVVE